MVFLGLIIIAALIWVVNKTVNEYKRLDEEYREYKERMEEYEKKSNKREEKFKQFENLDKKMSSMKEDIKALESLKANMEFWNKTLEKQEKNLDNTISKLEKRKEKIETTLNNLEVDYYYEAPLDYKKEALNIEDGLYEIDDWNEIDSKKLLMDLKDLKERERKSAKDGRANLQGNFPYIENDKVKEKIMKTVRKLVLRTFNGEADAAIAKVTHRNIETTHKKIQKSFDDLQKLSSYFGCRISIPYMKYKLKEANLVFDYELKKQQEKEEQRAIAEQMREEERARKEIEKAQREAALEEKKAQEALEKAKKDLENAHGEELTKLQEKMALLEAQLKEAHENNQRATSMAQLTKSGHVYIISNIGSFGEKVYKIGMTRRLVPMDRVRELGDASVPFKFDVHAMIYSENAPELENILHKEFDRHRLNKVNLRREFFKVDLDHVREVVEKNYGEFKLTMMAEAAEYRKSLEIEKELLKVEKIEEVEIA